MTGPRRMRLGLLAAVLTVGPCAVGLAQAQTSGSGSPAASLPGATVPTTGLPSTSLPTETPSVTVSVPGTNVGPVATPPVTLSTPSTGSVTTPVQPPGGVPSVPPVTGGPSSSAESTLGAAGSGASNATAASRSNTPPAAGNPSSRGAVRDPQRPAPPSGRRSRRRGSQPVGSTGSGLGRAAAKPVSTTAANPIQRAASHRLARTHSQGNPLDAIGRHIPLPIPVPDWSKPIIAALLLLALWLGVRSRVAALRARRLEGQRAALLRDVGFMQAALVPEIPARLGGLAVSVAYRPAEGPAAGGDFYDVFVPATGKVAVILGDVAGHGHDALRQAALIRYTLRAYIQAGLEPRMALALAGRALGQPGGEYFATVAVGIYDRRGSRLTYSLAGHPPPIFSGVAAPEPLTICSSPPVGWTMPTGRRQSSVTLPPRSEVCFFSDGLVEARLEEGLLGRERLSRILGELGQRAQATDLLERVTDAARETPDDMAACILAPEVGAISERVHVEELEADLHDLASGEVNRFMQACRIPSRVIAPTIEHASEIASASGTVLLRMDLGSAGATVTAVAPPVAALVPLPVAPAASRETDRVRTGALSLDEQAPVEQPPLPSLPLRRASDRARSATGPATAELL